jgi:alpha-galactosidase
MGIWSMMASPLILALDPRDCLTLTLTCTAPTLATIKNANVIGIDQDPLGAVGLRISQTVCGAANCEVWAKQLTGTNKCAIALLNRDAAVQNITATFATIAGVIPGCGSGPYTVTKNAWSGASLGTLTTSYTATAVASHDVAIIIVSP